MPNAARHAETDTARDDDHFVQLQIGWADFERVLLMRGDRSAPRMCYSDGTLEMMSPSYDHELIKSLIGRLVECYCMENEIECTAAGAWTLKNKRAKKASEPDECYVFGPREGKARPKVPQLAIEVMWSAGGIDKLPIYAALGVSEVWVWRHGRIVPHVLRGGSYKPATRSRVLPALDLRQLCAHLDTGIATTAAIKRYRVALQGR